MNLKKTNAYLKYVPKISTALIFLILLVLFMILFFGRNLESLRFNFILKYFPEFYSHVSNLSLTYLIYSTIGYIWLMLGVRFRYIILVGILIVGCNFIIESNINILNTPDIVDAYYGLLGTVLGFVFIFLSKIAGLQSNEAYQAVIVAGKSRQQE